MVADTTIVKIVGRRMPASSGNSATTCALVRSSYVDSRARRSRGTFSAGLPDCARLEYRVRRNQRGRYLLRDNDVQFDAGAGGQRQGEDLAGTGCNRMVRRHRIPFCRAPRSTVRASAFPAGFFTNWRQDFLISQENHEPADTGPTSAPPTFRGPVRWCASAARI
jgi:hypothetical protein